MKILPLSLLIIALVVSACASKPKPTPTRPPPTETLVPTPTPIRRPPDGTYTTKITQQELITAGMDEYTACENAGTFELTITADRWDIIQTAAPGCTVLNPKFGGAVMFLGDQASFHDDEPFGCSADYTYQWDFTGNVLRFSTFNDVDCTQRAYFMSKHPWGKVR